MTAHTAVAVLVAVSPGDDGTVRLTAAKAQSSATAAPQTASHHSCGTRGPPRRVDLEDAGRVNYGTRHHPSGNGGLRTHPRDPATRPGLHALRENV